MKKQTEILLFLAILIGIVLSLNYIYIKKVSENVTTFRREKMFEDYIKNQDHIDYLFLGDSHTGSSIMPSYINSSFNYASNSESYVKTYYKLKKITESNTTVKIIIIELDPNSLSAQIEKDGGLMNELFIYSKFIPYEDISKIRNKQIISLWIEANLPVLGNGGDLGYIIFKPEYSEINLGWLEIKGNLSKMTPHQKEMEIERYTTMYKEGEMISDIVLEHFLKTITLANENNISIMIIKHPLTQEYFEAINLSNKSVDEYYEEVFEKIEVNYTILDYSDYYPNKTEYFANLNHLNREGAEEFSKQLSSDLKRFEAEQRLKEINEDRRNKRTKSNYA